jgi:two-component system, chemotaxis family, sensor kinase CheA
LSRSPDNPGAELRELFFETAQELLQSLNDEALKLEKQPGDVETVRSIRRVVHTLKGDAAAVGFRELSELAHELEDALALETAAAHRSLAEIAFQAADLFEGMLKAYRKQGKLPSIAGLQKRVQALSGSPKSRTSRRKKGEAPDSVAVQIAWTDAEKLAMQQAAEQGLQVFQVQVTIDPDCAMPIAARQLVRKALSEGGKVLGSRPEQDSTQITKQFDLLVASSLTSEQLAAKCRIPTVVAKAMIEALSIAGRKTGVPTLPPVPVHDAPSVPEQSATQVTAVPTAEDEAAIKSATAPAENILRVDAERIDNVLNLVGELIIGKSMLQQAVTEFTRRYPKDAMRGRFADAMAFQARVLGDLQRSVMKVRMVPVEQLFRRFPRMVRDVARQCGKEVQLVLSGEDTDLDKGLLDSIAEPLTHLVRNAIGHGIESKEERVRNGKPAQGTVRLDAYHQGNQVIVEVADDGRGIDVQKVKTRAVERALLNHEQAAKLSESEALALIFQPGFSTADEITEISGRGVGLDVVQSVLNRIKGLVQVDSRPGQGTTFRLQLPLTLAIIKALLFRVEHRLYAIPLNSVSEIARAHEFDLHQVDGRDVLQLRNQVLPVIRLGRAPSDTPAGYQSKIFVLVIHGGERKFGLLVNSLEGEEELVIKALDDYAIETDLVSGASILGDGRVVLILNLATIVDRFVKSTCEDAANPSFGMLLSHADKQRTMQDAPGRQP